MHNEIQIFQVSTPTSSLPLGTGLDNHFTLSSQRKRFETLQKRFSYGLRKIFVTFCGAHSERGHERSFSSYCAYLFQLNCVMLLGCCCWWMLLVLFFVREREFSRKLISIVTSPEFSYLLFFPFSLPFSLQSFLKWRWERRRRREELKPKALNNIVVKLFSFLSPFHGEIGWILPPITGLKAWAQSIFEVNNSKSIKIQRTNYFFCTYFPIFGLRRRVSWLNEYRLDLERCELKEIC